MDGAAAPLAYLRLTKPRVLLLLNLVAAAAMLVASGGRWTGWQLAVLVFSGGLSCAGSGALNNYLDREIDATMPRTMRRPLPQGLICPPWRAAYFGLLLLAVGLLTAYLWLGFLSTLFIGLGAFFYVGVYTFWLKRRTPLNVVIGGIAGGCAALAGWVAVEGSIGLPALLMAGIVFAWTPGHFWALAVRVRMEYKAAGVPMLPVVAGMRRTAWSIMGSHLAVVLLSAALYHLESFGVTYVAVNVVLGAASIAYGGRLVIRQSEEAAWGAYKVSTLYLMALYLAIVFERLQTVPL